MTNSFTLTARGLLVAFFAGGFLFINSSFTASAQEDANSHAVRVGSNTYVAPDFTVPTLRGGEFTLSAQAGKPVVLYFMAYWCSVCVPEAQALSKLHAKYGDQVTIIALDVDPSSTPERLQKFRSVAGNPDYIWAFDKGNRVAQTYRIRSLDSTIILNQNGEIAYSDRRPTTFETLEEQIKKLLR